MEVNQDRMLHYLRQVADLKIQRIFIAEESPHAASGEFFVNTQENPRFIIPLTHHKRILFAEDGSQKNHIFTPGEVLFCPAYCWSAEVWDREHTMVSVVFRRPYIRTLFVHHHGDSNIQDAPDIVYHTQMPLSTAGTHLLLAISSAAKSSASQIQIFKALITTVIEAVENDHPSSSGKEKFTWNCVREYMEMSFHHDITRVSIAKALHLHPASLSRLVRKMTGDGVNQYLSKLRMKHALHLLKESDLSIDEIAEQCGFHYTGYFIRKFRSCNSDSPSRYRIKYRESLGRNRQ